MNIEYVSLQAYKNLEILFLPEIKWFMNIIVIQMINIYFSHIFSLHLHFLAHVFQNIELNYSNSVKCPLLC